MVYRQGQCHVGSGYFSRVRDLKVKVTVYKTTNSKNPGLDHNSLLPSWIWIIFHILVVNEIRVSNGSELYLKGQGNSARCHSSLLPRQVVLIFYKIVVHESRVWHDLGPS